MEDKEEFYRKIRDRLSFEKEAGKNIAGPMFIAALVTMIYSMIIATAITFLLSMFIDLSKTECLMSFTGFAFFFSLNWVSNCIIHELGLIRSKVDLFMEKALVDHNESSNKLP